MRPYVRGKVALLNLGVMLEKQLNVIICAAARSLYLAFDMRDFRTLNANASHQTLLTEDKCICIILQ